MNSESITVSLAVLFLISIYGKFSLFFPILLFSLIYSPFFKSINNNNNNNNDDDNNITTVRKRKVRKIIAPNVKKLSKKRTGDIYTVSTPNTPIYIFYSSLTGTSKRIAQQIFNQFKISNNELEIKILSIDDDIDDLDDYFIKIPNGNPRYILVLPSYETDSPIDYFLEFLNETNNDFRIDKFPLNSLTGFTVVGLGDSESWGGEKEFCYQASIADNLISKLGGRRMFPLGKICVKKDFKNVADGWINRMIDVFNDNEPFLFEEDDDDDEEDDESNSSDKDTDTWEMEDLNKSDELPDDNGLEKKQMVAKDSPTYKSLTKQGYTVVGSHSGVKICRWTKAALRGRGFCYKYAFYGINSHRCMETTPALSCSNKCVFCWRHGTNPVGTTWRWEVDKPELILKGALEGHYSKIKQMRGVPGVISKRFDEAFKVRHCALSLVGEPIFYPYINEFLKMLHDEEISSFLVCNAQHPDQLRTLSKVTQLYVSIDAGSKNELKIVDRPLFRDFWERMEECLDILRTIQKNQRTVFRLTLVKGFNMNEIQGYADLVERGLPSLIEIKGATFCGSSDGNGNPLTMQNIPFYEECVKFVNKLNEELNRRGLNYGISAEHSHSCCFLIANEKFLINGEWYTHIDYEKFFQLLKSGKEFNEMDYIAKTPKWAYFGSKEGGFSPDDVRFIRKQKKELKE